MTVEPSPAQLAAFIRNFCSGRTVYRCPGGCQFDVSVTMMENLVNDPVCHICGRHNYSQFKKVRIVLIPEE